MRRIFHITMVCGFNDQAMTRTLWRDIKGLRGSINGAWAIMGDFNRMLNMDERIGRPFEMAEIREFRQCVEECEVQDLKSSVSFFTWNNKQRGEDRVWSKIDRALVDSDWMTNLPRLKHTLCMKKI